MAGYASGPDAPLVATATALARAESARVVVLVEGVSDQIAVETLAVRTGRDLADEGVVVVPIGGAHAIARYLHLFGPQGAGLDVVGLCDAGEEAYLGRAVGAAGLGSPTSRAALEQLGFFVCVEDLEDELVRAAGPARWEALLDAQDDLGSFRTLQGQPAWRRRDFRSQQRRWLGAGSRRKIRYAQLLTAAVPPDRLPRPLTAVLAASVTIAT